MVNRITNYYRGAVPSVGGTGKDKGYYVSTGGDRGGVGITQSNPVTPSMLNNITPRNGALKHGSPNFIPTA